MNLANPSVIAPLIQTTNESNEVVFNITKFLEAALLTLNNSPDGTKIILHSDSPIELEFTENIGISSRKNIVLATGEKLHLNPAYSDDVDDVVDFKDINKFNESLEDINRSMNVGHSCSIEQHELNTLHSQFARMRAEYKELGDALQIMESRLCQQ